VLRWLWFGLGWVAVAVGSVGIVVPGLPTSVFFIIAAACFSRSSPRFEQWVLDRAPLKSSGCSGRGTRTRVRFSAESPRSSVHAPSEASSPTTTCALALRAATSSSSTHPGTSNSKE
jgi:hypothetical protein